MTEKMTETTPAEPTMSLLKAAIKILGESDEPLNSSRIVEEAKRRGYWKPGKGWTPDQTLYSSIAREIKAKGDAARFVKVASGRFALRG